SRAGCDRLFVLMARLAKMHVNVDQPRRYDPASPQFEHLGTIDRKSASHARNRAVLDQHVHVAVASVGGIDNASAFEQRLHQSASASWPARRYNTAIRTATPF